MASFTCPEPAEVRALGPWSSVKDSAIEPFVDDACDFIDDVLAGKHPDATLRRITKWWAAHLYSNADTSGTGRRTVEYRAGRTMERFEGEKGDVAEIGFYASEAIRMDTTGLLAGALGISVMEFSIGRLP